MLRFATLALSAMLLMAASSNSFGQQFQDAQLQQHLKGGEFAAAARAAQQQLPPQQRDAFLAQIATAQSQTGETTAASQTVRGIQTPGLRQQAVEQTRGATGGGAFADFDSLMQLIQTTVVPDTWEALGGPSTMAPYPQGVYVDAAGTVQSCERLASDDAVSELQRMLQSSAAAEASAEEAADWRRPAALRCVSLRRLNDEWTRRRMLGLPAGEVLTHMAGLSRVQYIMLNDDDILLVGPVGGIASVDGWYRDTETGLTPWRLDFLTAALAGALRNQPFGCTIDPTTEGLQRAASVATAVSSDKIPIGKAAEAMVEALGMQRVEVFGTAGDTPIGYLMVEADRHMKELALGIHPMPRGVQNYMDLTAASIQQGPPKDLLLRLWFTAAARPVRANEERTVFELAGTPIRLSGQNERAVASGQRGLITRDPRSEQFVAHFNDHWSAIRQQYPIYAALESVYRAASVSETVRRFATEPEQQALLESLIANESTASVTMPAPRQVQSIATMRTVRHGRKLHHIIVASGGVAVQAGDTVADQVIDYPTLTSLQQPAETQPRVVQRWWWDVNGR